MRGRFLLPVQNDLVEESLFLTKREDLELRARLKIPIPRVVEEEPNPSRTKMITCCVVFVIVSLITLFVLILVSYRTFEAIFYPVKPPIRRVAFGSCTTYNNMLMPIFDQVITRNPDVWVWNGDFMYLDEAVVNCGLPQWKNSSHCNCPNNDWLRVPPYGCHAADVENSLKRVRMGLDNPDYERFLQFMCPDYDREYSSPPPGQDASICPKPIYGVYDDHDYTWNDGNKRLPQKHVLKQIFLDAIGEPANSNRRSSNRGIEAKIALNEGQDDEIGVFLLDERYYRESLPCYARKSYCDPILANPNHPKYGYCQDLFVTPNPDVHNKPGTCCDKDEKIFYGWCADSENRVNHTYYNAACDPTSPEFGNLKLTLDENGELVPFNGGHYESPFCEVLGASQRDWFAKSLFKSQAKLNLIFSPSVLVSRPNYTCWGDDFDCYRPAQINLLNTIINSGVSCPVIIVGDYHIGDIRVFQPGNQPYTSVLGLQNLKSPLYQLMSSGMTQEVMGSCSAIADPWGLRVDNKCTSQPNFGEVEIDWDKGGVTLRLVNDNGDIPIEHSFKLKDCAGSPHN